MKLTKAKTHYELETPLMRTNSSVRDRSWLAEITGENETYGFERKFVKSDRYQERRAENGTQIFRPLRENVFYEYRDIKLKPEQSGSWYNKEGGRSGFFIIKDDELQEVSKTEVLESVIEGVK